MRVLLSILIFVFSLPLWANIGCKTYVLKDSKTEKILCWSKIKAQEVLISKNCKDHKCEAFKSHLKAKSTPAPIREEDQDEGATMCQQLGTPIYAYNKANPKGGEILLCQFKDGSFIQTYDLNPKFNE